MPLSGGRGLTWRVGDVVLKPADGGEETLAWQARILAEIRPEDVRVARPLPATTGAFTVDGWSGSVFCAGRHESGRWLDIIDTGRRLHRALASVDRPELLAARTDPWAVADRAAWGEVALDPFRGSPHVSRLESCLALVRAPSQVIHGDLTGNVLFADPQSPAVIDLSAYWRPPEYATAIVVADALTWEGAAVDDLAPAFETEAFGQLLARALLYRIIADIGGDAGSSEPWAGAYARAVELAVRLTRNDR